MAKRMKQKRRATALARQDAAAELLASHGRAPMTDVEVATFEQEIATELARQVAKGADDGAM